MANVSISQATNTAPLGTDLIPIARVGSTTPYNVSISSIANGSVSSFTQGSVLFVGAGGVFSQNNAALFWDNANSRLGVGTSSPGTKLDVTGDSRVTGNFYVTGSSSIGSNFGAYPNSALTINPTVNPTTIATSNQLTIGEATHNTAFNLSIGYLNISGSYRGTIQSYDNGIANALLINPSGGNVGIGTTSPGSPLDVVGNINGSSGSFGYLSTSSSTSTTPTLSFNAANTSVAKGATVAGSYVQDVIQNKSATAGASANYVVSPNNGTDSTFYGEFGVNSSVFSASTPADFFSLNNQIYFSGHDGDIAIGSGNGYKTYFPWGATAASAHVINASGAWGLSTNLGTTLANSGTIGYGTSGQALITAGSGAAPAWGVLGGAGGGTGVNNGSNTLTLGGAVTFSGAFTQTFTATAATSVTVPTSGTLLSTTATSLYSAAPLFGTGADGAVTISSGTTTLTRDANYTNLTLSGSGRLNTNGYRIFVSGTLDITACTASAIYFPANAGNNASGATGGGLVSVPANAQATMPLPWYQNQSGPTIGANGGIGAGATPAAGSGSNSGASIGYGGAGAAGAAGGTGSNGAGGAGSAGNGTHAFNNNTTATHANPWVWPGVMFFTNTSGYILPGFFGAAGGAGGGDGTNAGGGGGSPGSPGGHLLISARFINRGASTPVGAITAYALNSGNGGNGAGGNAGGGGGAGGSGGGVVALFYEALLGTTATNAIDVSGGKGGNGGNGVGTGLGGLGATGGNGGYIVQFPQNGGVIVQSSFGAAGTAATAPSGITGGIGGVGATVQGNL